jgi:hypothetical protein
MLNTREWYTDKNGVWPGDYTFIEKYAVDQRLDDLFRGLPIALERIDKILRDQAGLKRPPA